MVRIVEGVHGAVEMDCTVRFRFDYGHILPWVQRAGGRILAAAGPDSIWLDSPVPLTGRDMAHRATFTVRAGDLAARSGCAFGRPLHRRRSVAGEPNPSRYVPPAGRRSV